MSKPTHLMVCISGFSGVGKDECAAHLVRTHHAMHTGLADPAKRHMADVYDFTEQQLFGPSQFRNAGDSRYPKTIYQKMRANPCPKSDLPFIDSTSGGWHCFTVKNEDMSSFDPDGRYADLQKINGPMDGWSRYFFRDTDPRFFLSPREALQLYCEQLNNLYLDTWIRKGIEVHKKLAEVVEGNDGQVRSYGYTRMGGLFKDPYNETPATSHGCVITCFSDFRHKHEIALVRKITDENILPILVRVKRPGIDKPPFQHRSETEQATIQDNEFDFVVENKGTIEDLHSKMDEIVKIAAKRQRPFARHEF